MLSQELNSFEQWLNYVWQLRYLCLNHPKLCKLLGVWLSPIAYYYYICKHTTEILTSKLHVPGLSLFKQLLVPCSILVSRRSAQSQTGTVPGAAALSQTQPLLSCWSTVTVWTPPVCTDSSVTPGRSATAWRRSSTTTPPQTDTLTVRARAASAAGVRRGATSWELHHRTERPGGAQRAPYCPWVKTPQRDMTAACPTLQPSTASTVRLGFRVLSWGLWNCS